jgi:hypothetical protein
LLKSKHLQCSFTRLKPPCAFQTYFRKLLKIPRERLATPHVVLLNLGALHRTNSGKFLLQKAIGNRQNSFSLLLNRQKGPVYAACPTNKALASVIRRITTSRTENVLLIYGKILETCVHTFSNAIVSVMTNNELSSHSTGKWHSPFTLTQGQGQGQGQGQSRDRTGRLEISVDRTT